MHDLHFLRADGAAQPQDVDEIELRRWRAGQDRQAGGCRCFREWLVYARDDDRAIPGADGGLGEKEYLTLPSPPAALRVEVHHGEGTQMEFQSRWKWRLGSTPGASIVTES
jgi:hypothetical protein